jgi:hypothetical protein
VWRRDRFWNGPVDGDVEVRQAITASSLNAVRRIKGHPITLFDIRKIWEQEPMNTENRLIKKPVEWVFGFVVTFSLLYAYWRDAYTAFLTAVLIVSVVFLFKISGAGIKAAEKRKKAFWENIPDFKASKIMMGVDNKSGVAVDESRRKVCLVTVKDAVARMRSGQVPDKSGLFIDISSTELSGKVITHKDLLSVEIFQDGDSITKTTRMSQVGAALVGNFFLGPAGALIGALTSKKKTTGLVNQIALRILINDSNSPLHDVLFLNAETKKDSPIYKAASELARNWHGTLEVFIRQSDREDQTLVSKSQPPQGTQIAGSSIADELTKLASLRQSNMITDDEYQRLKAKLI